jgi:hypothetical protein
MSIPARIAAAVAGAGLDAPATLTKFTAGTRTPGALSAGTNPTSTDYAARGRVVSWRRDRLGGTLVEVNDRVVRLFAATIAGGVAPSIGDTITIESVTARIVGIERGGASASYTCLVRK